jgi:carbohydrate diacid regulator
MILSERIAREIIQEVASVVSTNINLMDENGRIIASTNPNRVGFIHQGALHVLKDKLEELYIQDEDSLLNVKPGLNLPIIIDKKTVGVVGLTGPFEEVSQISRIVKRMTEILLRDQLAKQKQDAYNLQRERFFDSILYSKESLSSQEIIDLSSRIGFDISKPRFLIIFQTIEKKPGCPTLNDQERWNEQNHFFSSVSKNNSLEIFHKNDQWITFAGLMSKNNIQELCDRVENEFKDRTGVQLVAGISSLTQDGIDYPSMYLQAKKALKASKKHRHNVFFYDDSSLEILLSDIDTRMKQDYIKALFPETGDEEICKIMILLREYFNTGGSLLACSENLFIHPNTLQYKLRKLVTITGHDVRIVQDSPIFYIGLIFYEDLTY